MFPEEAQRAGQEMPPLFAFSGSWNDLQRSPCSCPVYPSSELPGAGGHTHRDLEVPALGTAARRLWLPLRAHQQHFLGARRSPSTRGASSTPTLKRRKPDAGAHPISPASPVQEPGGHRCLQVAVALPVRPCPSSPSGTAAPSVGSFPRTAVTPPRPPTAPQGKDREVLRRG